MTGTLPEIDVDEINGDLWLWWHVTPLRIEICLTDGSGALPWLYVEGEASEQAMDDALTRMRLMDRFAADIRANREAGLAALRAAATAAGLMR